MGGTASFLGNEGRDLITNAGAMIGDVFLFAGNDVYDGRGGRVVGIVNGGDDEDRFIPGGTAERFVGGDGRDTLDLRASSGGKVFVEPEAQQFNTGVMRGDVFGQIETVLGSLRGADWIIGFSEDSRIVGAGGRDTLDGGFGSDTLLGGIGNDRMIGRADSDQLYGGAGRDMMSGGAGRDYFAYARASEGGDRITDFNPAEDQFDFNLRGFGLDPSQGVRTGWFHTGRSNHAADGNDHFIFRTTDATLWFDADGRGGRGPVLIADLPDGVDLTLTNLGTGPAFTLL